MLDIAIIGSGPAGLSAAINAAQRNKTVAVFGRGIETSMLYKAEKVDNYIGMPAVTGKAMLEEFYNHAKTKGVEIKKSKVYQIFKTGDHYTLNADNNFVEAKKVIIAMEHLSKGTVKIVKKCTLPLTAHKEVDMIVTERCVFEFQNGIMTLIEINPMYSIDDIKASVFADFKISPNLKIMEV